MFKKRHWNNFDKLPVWVGFAWFGCLKMKNIHTGKTIEVKAGGTYCDNGRNMEFKIENWNSNRNINDYQITHYITRPDKVPDLFNTNNSLFRKLAETRD